MTSKIEQPRISCFALALQRWKTYLYNSWLMALHTKRKTKTAVQIRRSFNKISLKDLDRSQKLLKQYSVHQWCKHSIYAFSAPSEYFQLALAAYNFALRKSGQRHQGLWISQLTKKGKYINYKITLLYHQQSDTFEVATCDSRQIKF